MSWQIVPNILLPADQDPDREKSQRVMAAMLEMRKIEIDEPRKGCRGGVRRIRCGR